MKVEIKDSAIDLDKTTKDLLKSYKKEIAKLNSKIARQSYTIDSLRLKASECDNKAFELTQLKEKIKEFFKLGED